MKRRVILTGIGIISPIGLGLEEFWRSCLDAKTIVTQIPAHWYDYYDYTSSLWAPLPTIDYSAYGLRRIERMQMDDAQLVALSATKLALDNANLKSIPKDEKKNTYRLESVQPDRCGVYIGTGVGGLTSSFKCQGNHLFSSTKKLNSEIRSQLADDEQKLTLRTLDRLERIMRMPTRFNPFVVPMTMPNGSSGQASRKISLSSYITRFFAKFILEPFTSFEDRLREGLRMTTLILKIS
ncbi:hypothetical protein IH992_10010 [Candidatus Poribacteria bacterium]|nr:hypothetical protein [Candidatus Poribacteria bacterium]